MEGPLLVVKSWALTALVIWVYQRWFQRVAPPAPAFDAFCRQRPLIAAVWGVQGAEAQVAASITGRLQRGARAVATLGTYPWPLYRLQLGVAQHSGLVLLRIEGAEVKRTRDAALPALAHLLRDVLNELPQGAEAWLHAGMFDNGLVGTPRGGWRLLRGDEKRPQLARLEELPDVLTARATLGSSEYHWHSAAQRAASSPTV